MKLPREFLVGDTIWRVKFKRHIEHGTDRNFQTLGLCDASIQEIHILLGLSPKERLRVFIHEVIHALEAEFGFVVPHDDVLEKLDRAITRLLLDNFL